ncbi:MAG: von Willebrand factor type A domain-containing protein [Anaerolineales bacterium]|nr:von Willebrand factor type A domain-containing protein [Anaerolineales bacterium]
MNKLKLLSVFVLLGLFIAACQPASTQVAPQTVGEYQPSRPIPTAAMEEPIEQSSPLATQPIGQFPAAQPTPLPQPTFQPPPAGFPPADNYFRDYGLNPFVDTREDHLSTFALDVDTASYSVARRYIQDGLLPPPEAVRVEEFVNYFEQEYPSPPEVAFGIYADGARSPFHTDGTYILRFGVQGYQVPDFARSPANLTFVIDVSGSMAGETRLGLVKRSLELLTEQLGPQDRVAIVVYGSQARVVLRPTSGSDTRYILWAINSLKTEGSTNAEAGLRAGYQLAWEMFQPGYINRVILLSDGVANVGATGPNQILESVRGYAEQGITLTSVGFGMGNFNDVLMERLADDGDGNYAYVDTLAEARKIFVEDLTSTLQVIALDAKVQVDFNPEVVARYRLIGYENRDVADEDFRDDTVDAGEIGAGHSVTALYAVQLWPQAEGRLATVQLRWEDPNSHEIHEINGNFNRWDLAESFAETSPRYKLAVVVAQYAELLRKSPWSWETHPYELQDHTNRLVQALPADPEVREFRDLVWQANQIGALGN